MTRLRRLGLAMAVTGLLAMTPGAVLADSANHSYLMRKVGVQNRIALSVHAITHSLVSKD